MTQRIEQLARREVRTWLDEDGFTRGDNGRPPFKMLIGLERIIAETLGVGPGTKRVEARYMGLVNEFGSELAVLTRVPLSDVARASSGRIAEGVDLIRTGSIHIKPGYDGLYGTVHIWEQ